MTLQCCRPVGQPALKGGQARTRERETRFEGRFMPRIRGVGRKGEKGEKELKGGVGRGEKGEKELRGGGWEGGRRG